MSEFERQLREEGDHWRAECDRLLEHESEWEANREPYKAAILRWLDAIEKLYLLKSNLGKTH